MILRNDANRSRVIRGRHGSQRRSKQHRRRRMPLRPSYRAESPREAGDSALEYNAGDSPDDNETQLKWELFIIFESPGARSRNPGVALRRSRANA
jgi:hypothetical protein